MRWIINEDEAEHVLQTAKAYIAHADRQQKSAELTRLTFDCVEFQTRKFFEFLRQLMEWSGDVQVYYLVLEPDPLSYFFAHFGKYPLLEISINDSGDAYITALNEDPGNSPADAVGTNWYEYIILPASGKWLIHSYRDARSGEGGHLWVPPIWVDKVRDSYPYQLY